jgi:peptide/nickel transport system permease protein
MSRALSTFPLEKSWKQTIFGPRTPRGCRNCAFYWATPCAIWPSPISALGVSFRFSLSTLILVEFLFAWPGIGRTLFSAVQEGHVALVVGLTLVIALTVQAINFFLDVAYRLIDPRTWERL